MNMVTKYMKKSNHWQMHNHAYKTGKYEWCANEKSRTGSSINKFLGGISYVKIIS